MKVFLIIINIQNLVKKDSIFGTQLDKKIFIFSGIILIIITVICYLLYIRIWSKISLKIRY